MIPAFFAYIQQAGIDGASMDSVSRSFLGLVAQKVAILHAITGTFIPLFVVALMTRFFGAKKSFVDGLKVWKFALFSAFSMTIPYVIAAYVFGPEFPSIFGGMVGLLIVIPAAKAGWFMPNKDEIWDFPDKAKWEPEWTGLVKIQTDPINVEEKNQCQF